MWIKAEILCINFTPNLYNALTETIVYITTDITIPVNSMMSQMNTLVTQRTFLQVPVNGPDVFWDWWIGAGTYLAISSCTRELFLHVQGLYHGHLAFLTLKVIRWSCSLRSDIFCNCCANNKMMIYSVDGKRQGDYKPYHKKGLECIAEIRGLIRNLTRAVGEWVSEWLNLMAFLGTVDSEDHIVHISCVITAYTLESLSSLT